MATQGTYYLDAPSLATASAIYTDAAMTTPAPDGYYAAGGIVRQIVDGVLLPSEVCTACLESYNSSTIQLSAEDACLATVDQTYYVSHVGGSGGVLGLGDFVFSDVNGDFQLAAGFYKTTSAGPGLDWYEVDASGSIITIGYCQGVAIADCGVSNTSASGACSDSVSNPKTLYCDCMTPAINCKLYWDANMTNPVTELYVKALSNWDMDGLGTITASSSVQC